MYIVIRTGVFSPELRIQMTVDFSKAKQKGLESFLPPQLTESHMLFSSQHTQCSINPFTESFSGKLNDFNSANFGQIRPRFKDTHSQN